MQGHVALRLDALGVHQLETDAGISVCSVDSQPPVSRTELLGSPLEKQGQPNQLAVQLAVRLQLVPRDADAACAAWCRRWCRR